MKYRRDNYSMHKQFSKGYINYRVSNIDKMRDYETLRGFFSPNRIEYIRGKLVGFTRAFFQVYGREEAVLRRMVGRRFRLSFSISDAIFIFVTMVCAGISKKILRLLYVIEYSRFHEPPVKTILQDQTDYICFEGKTLFDINVRDVWRPSIITKPGEIITSMLEPAPKSEVRLSFALLENADPMVCDSHWGVRVKCTLASSNNNHLRDFYIPIFHETDDVEDEKNPLWLEFSLDLKQYARKKVRLDIVADYESSSKNNYKVLPLSSPAFAWGAPRKTIKKKPVKTKKILFVSIESFTDPFFVSSTYKTKINNVFSFLEENEWTVFPRAYAQSDGTLGAASSYLTGLTPVQHGIFDYGSPYWSRYGWALNRRIALLSQLIKGKGFSTISVGPKAFSGHIGLSGGFDTHYGYYSHHDPDYVDHDWFVQNWDSVSQSDALIFMHLERLHKPYIHFNRRRNKIYSISELDNSQSPVELYMHQMEEQDLQLKRLLDFLHRTGQYDNTMIIVTGDHGGAYNWKKRQVYDLYEDRVRVPLWIKVPDWLKNNDFTTDEPVNGSTLPFQIILDALGIHLPAYFSDLPQQSDEFTGIAISETQTHPTCNDYVLSLTESDFKYVRSMKVDWTKNTLLSIEKEILQPFPYASNDTELTNDYSSTYPEKFLHLKRLADIYVKSSLEFRSRYAIEKAMSRVNP